MPAAPLEPRADGELRRGAGPEGATMLVAVVQGLNVMAKARPGRRELQGVAEAALTGLAASPSPG
jgi:TetR/AcrR family transcriptional regulator, transcriptional repressor for nem operon